MLQSTSLHTLKSHLHAGQTSRGDGGLAAQYSITQNGLDGTTSLVDKPPAKTSLNGYSTLFINAQARPEEVS